jgi:hypothetical protein
MDEKRKRGRPAKPKLDSKPEPKKMGRPKLEVTRNAELPLVRLYEQELDSYKLAAKTAGLPLSEWVREQLSAAAEQAQAQVLAHPE